MSQEEFLDSLFEEDDVPTDPDELLEMATLLYDLYLNAPPDSPLRQSNEINWEEFGLVIQKAREADDEVKRLEQLSKEADENPKKTLGALLSNN